MTAQEQIYFSSIVFRPKLAEQAPSIHLGWALEFTASGYWVVGLGMRAVIDPKDMAKIDPLSRELLENRSKLFESDITHALLGASQVGDVLGDLSDMNPWSIFIGKPKAIPAESISAGASIEHVLEQYILTLYRRTIASEKAAPTLVPAGSTRQRAAEPCSSPVGTPPPWMLPPRHWSRPLIQV